MHNTRALNAYLEMYLGTIKNHIITEIINTASTERYFMSGAKITEEDQKRIIELVIDAAVTGSFLPEARGITLSEAHASFLPSDEAITNNLAEGANSASDQKTSSTLVPANTPVFIVSQILD